MQTVSSSEFQDLQFWDDQHVGVLGSEGGPDLVWEAVISSISPKNRIEKPEKQRRDSCLSPLNRLLWQRVESGTSAQGKIRISRQCNSCLVPSPSEEGQRY